MLGFESGIRPYFFILWNRVVLLTSSMSAVFWRFHPLSSRARWMMSLSGTSKACLSGRISWSALGWKAGDLLFEINVQLDELEALEHQVERLDARIAELYSEVDPEQRLKRVGGLGEFLSAAITAHIGDVSRFPSSKHLVSYSGLVTPPARSLPGQR